VLVDDRAVVLGGLAGVGKRTGAIVLLRAVLPDAPHLDRLGRIRQEARDSAENTLRARQDQEFHQKIDAYAANPRGGGRPGSG
jgi:hypothetical protein